MIGRHEPLVHAYVIQGRPLPSITRA
jgi:hypothetical protein